MEVIGADLLYFEFLFVCCSRFFVVSIPSALLPSDSGRFRDEAKVLKNLWLQVHEDYVVYHDGLRQLTKRPVFKLKVDGGFLVGIIGLRGYIAARTVFYND